MLEVCAEDNLRCGTHESDYTQNYHRGHASNDDLDAKFKIM